MVNMTETTTEAAVLVDARRRAFQTGVTRPLEWRIAQLDALEAMLRENSDRFLAALKQDLNKPATEAWATEVGFAIADIKDQRSNLRSWAKPRNAKVPIAFQPATAKVVPEPKGVVLIIAPWNYPVQLLISPMAAAIAAGNAIVAKPSELAPATSGVLAELIGRYLDPATVSVIEGAVDVATDLLAQPFDHILFTGSPEVGKVVMRAAAEHLTPVTLELGGKSPAIVAADADINVAGRRIAWGKFVNAGQTCIAPDYVLVERSARDELVSAIERAVRGFYGSNPQASPDYGRIISDRHHQRLTALMEDEGAGAAAVGGVADASDRYIAPTVLLDPDPNSPVMSEEIFGPLLPIVTVDDVTEAIDFINSRPKPLALYAFTSNSATADQVIATTSSGGVGINQTLLHIGPPELPFGGIGQSGMGAYHGRTGFETFSHLKPVLDRRTSPDLPITYPPYTDLKQRLIKMVQ